MAPKDSIIVIKIGGSTLGNSGTTLEDILLLQSKHYKPVVVHGGGKLINKWMVRQGIFPRFVNGLRVTNEDSIDIVIAVLAGVVNKRMVAEISNAGGQAVGLSGIDGLIFESTIHGYGWHFKSLVVVVIIAIAPFVDTHFCRHEIHAIIQTICQWLGVAIFVN